MRRISRHVKRLSFGDMAPHRNLVGNGKAGVGSYPHPGQILPFEMQEYRFLQVRYELVQGPALSHDGNFKTLANVDTSIAKNRCMDRILHGNWFSRFRAVRQGSFTNSRAAASGTLWNGDSLRPCVLSISAPDCVVAASYAFIVVPFMRMFFGRIDTTPADDVRPHRGLVEVGKPQNHLLGFKGPISSFAADLNGRPQYLFVNCHGHIINLIICWINLRIMLPYDHHDLIIGP